MIRVPRSHVSLFCFLFLTFSVHICVLIGDAMRQAFVYVGPARSKNFGLCCSQPLICAPYQRLNQQLPVSSYVSADNFWLLFKKTMRIIFLNPIKKTVLILYKEILAVSINNNCLGKNFLQISKLFVTVLSL